MQLPFHSVRSTSAAFVLAAAFLSSSGLALEKPVLLGQDQDQSVETVDLENSKVANSGLSLSVTSEKKEAEDKQPVKTQGTHGAQPMESLEVPEPSFLTAMAAGTGMIVLLNHWRRRRVYR
jgi:hypothetical protein